MNRFIFAFVSCFLAVCVMVLCASFPSHAVSQNEDETQYADPRDSTLGAITGHLDRPSSRSNIMQKRARSGNYKDEDKDFKQTVLVVDASTGKVGTQKSLQKEKTGDSRYLLCSQCRAKAVIDSCEYCKSLDSDFDHLCDTCIKKALLDPCEKCAEKVKAYRESQGLESEKAEEASASKEGAAAAGEKSSTKVSSSKKHGNVFKRMFGSKHKNKKVKPAEEPKPAEESEESVSKEEETTKSDEASATDETSDAAKEEVKTPAKKSVKTKVKSTAEVDETEEAEDIE
jgi:hypothetical protein